MIPANPQILIRTISALLFVGLLGLAWDDWWHIAVGRDTFWEPPHIVVQSTVALVIFLSLAGWVWFRTKQWLTLAGVFLLVPVAGFFDEVWHRIFGVEDFSSIAIVLSPPHVALILAFIAGFAILLPQIRKDKEVSAQVLFGSFSLTGILLMLTFLALPLDPLEGWALAGFWGAGALSFLLVGALLFAARWLPGVAGATFVAALYLVVLGVLSFGAVEPAPGIVIQPHDHAPAWVHIFAILLAAALVDVSTKAPAWLRGGLAGLLWAGVVYGLSHLYFAPEFQYTVAEGTTAALSGAGGGAAAGLALQYLYKKEEHETLRPAP